MEEEKSTQEKLKEQIEELIGTLSDEGIRQDNVDYLYKLIDIHKDISNEDYWKEKMEMKYRTYGRNYMEGGSGNYGNYGTYGRRSRDSRGRYTEGGNYGRKYRGHDMIEEMADHYGNYMESRESGRYGSPETDKAFDYMLETAEEFFEHLFEESDSPEQVEKIKMTARKISEKRM